MRAPLTILIPALNAERSLPGCTAALFEGLDAGLVRELIVSDGGSTDDTEAIALRLGAEVVTGPPSRGGQLRRGAAQAGGAWLLVLHADTQLDPGWSEAVLAHMRARPDRAACFRLAFDQPGTAARITAGWANLRTRLFGLPYGDQGLLIPMSLYRDIGGYDDIPLMEDVALARKLGRRRLTCLPLCARTSARRYREDGWLRRGGANLLLLLRYLGGARPADLARRYGRG